MLFLPGCWDYQKINDRSQIIAVGVEPTSDNQKMLTYTLQVPVFQQPGQGGTAPGSGGGEPSSNYHNYVISALSFDEAVSKAQTQSDKGLYLGNIQLIVYSMKLSHAQFRRTTGEFMRNPRFEKLSWVEFSPQSPSDVLSAKTDLAPADSFERILSSSVKQHGYTVRTHLWEFWRDFWTIGRQPYGGEIQKTPTGFRVDGLVVPVRHNNCIELTPEETLYFNMLCRRVQSISFNVIDGEESFGVGEVNTKSNLSVFMNKGRGRVLRARIRVNALVLRDESDGMVLLSHKDMKRYERVMSDQIKAQVEQVIQKFQHNETDPFGFGETIVTQNPRMEEYVASQWPHDFAHSTSNIQVEVRLKRKGALR
uniref:Ger(x)C family spore germination protein n=1 Tax=Alicyclobacillus tolerans TaxID=90970 RepID=UPI004037B1FF